MRSLTAAVLILIILFLGGCKRKSPWDVNISSVEVTPVEVKRYEKVLFEIDPGNLRQEIDPYIDDYNLFLGEEINTPMGQQQLYDYITDPMIRDLYDDTQQVWSDIDELEEDLTLALRYLKYHFPQYPKPVFYSYISGLDFEHPVKYFEGNLIVGLDMFLGRDYENYEKVGVPAFKRTRFVPDAASVEIMREYGQVLQQNYPMAPETLLDFMVEEGKLLYFMDSMFPDLPDSLKISYTTRQINWAQQNEGHSWSFYVNNELLYDTERQMIQKLTGTGPFTAPFGNESAPRMAVYNGWQIVRSFMERNDDVSLEELFGMTDSREILSQSRYRP